MSTVLAASGRVRMVGFVPRRTLIATLAVILFLIVWNGYGWVTGPSRITPGLQAELAAAQRPYYDVAVQLPFPPRQYHIRLFQSYGTFAGANGNVALIRRITPARIIDISHNYWVQRIDLADIN